MGPTGPEASRAPSVLSRTSEKLEFDEGLPGADSKNAGDLARLGLTSSRRRMG